MDVLVGVWMALVLPAICQVSLLVDQAGVTAATHSKGRVRMLDEKTSFFRFSSDTMRGVVRHLHREHGDDNAKFSQACIPMVVKEKLANNSDQAKILCCIMWDEAAA